MAPRVDLSTTHFGVIVLGVLIGAPSVANAGAAPGSLDPSFSEDGWAAVRFEQALWDAAFGEQVLVTPSGRILLCGTVREAASLNKDFAFSRLSAEGDLDTTFDLDGRFTASIDLGGTDSDELVSCTLTATGEVVATGQAAYSFQPHTRAVALRAREGVGMQWQLDTTFAGDGRLVWDLRGGSDLASSGVDVLAFPDGDLLAGGMRFAQGDVFGVPWVSRLLPFSDDDWSALDTTFGAAGIFFFGDSSAWNTLEAVDTDLDGRLVSVGVTGGDRADILVFRLTSQGSLDPTFAGTGWRTIDLPGSSDEVGTSVRIGPANEIYVTGQADLTGGPSYTGLVIAKLRSDGTLDPSFGLAGMTFVPPEKIASSGAWAAASALQGNGQLVVAGAELLDSGEKNFLAVRFTRDGHLDSSFGDGGIARLATNPKVGAANNGAVSLAIQPDGRLLLAGSCWSVMPPPEVSVFCVARLENDYIFASGYESGNTMEWTSIRN